MPCPYKAPGRIEDYGNDEAVHSGVAPPALKEEFYFVKADPVLPHWANF